MKKSMEQLYGRSCMYAALCGCLLAILFGMAMDYIEIVAKDNTAMLLVVSALVLVLCLTYFRFQKHLLIIRQLRAGRDISSGAQMPNEEMSSDHLGFDAVIFTCGLSVGAVGTYYYFDKIDFGYPLLERSFEFLWVPVIIMVIINLLENLLMWFFLEILGMDTLQEQGFIWEQY